MPLLFINQVFDTFQKFKVIFEEYTTTNFIIWVVIASEMLETDVRNVLDDVRNKNLNLFITNVSRLTALEIVLSSCV